MTGEIVDEEMSTTTNDCPGYTNITSITSHTSMYNISSFLSQVICLIVITFRRPPTKLSDNQPFFVYRISRYYYALIGTAVTMIAGYGISIFTKDDERNFHLDLISPVVHCLVPTEKEKIVPGNTEYCSVDKALHIVTYNTEKHKEAEA